MGRVQKRSRVTSSSTHPSRMSGCDLGRSRVRRVEPRVCSAQWCPGAGPEHRYPRRAIPRAEPGPGVGWTRTCEIVAVDGAGRSSSGARCRPGSTRTAPSGASDLAPSGRRTSDHPVVPVLRAPWLLEWLYVVAVPRTRTGTERLAGDLARIGAVAAGRGVAVNQRADAVGEPRRRVGCTGLGRPAGQWQCVRYLEAGGGFLVWGTGSGSPEVEKYARRAGRTIPVAVLQRVQPQPSSCRRSSSMPKWCAISCTTVTATSSTTSSSARRSRRSGSRKMVIRSGSTPA